MNIFKNLKFQSYSDWLNLQSLLLLFGLVQIWVLTFYYKTPSNEWISWIANDGDKGAPYAFGQHYFGDYLAMHEVARARDISALGNSYPPLGVIPFWILSFFPYRIGLFLWFVVLIFALVFPVLYALKRKREHIWVVSLVVFSLITVPAISVLDRANSVGLLTLFLFLFYLNSSRNRINISALWLGLAIGIKVYPLVIIPFLIVRRQFKTSILSVFYAAILNIFATLIWHKGNPIGAMNFIIRRIASTEKIWKDGHGMYVSGAQILVNIFDKFGLNHYAFVAWLISNYLILSVFILSILLIGALRSVGNNWIFYALAAVQIIPSGAFSYYRVWSIVLVAVILLKNIDMDGKHGFSIFDKIWIFACSLNLTTLTLLNFWPINILPTLSFLLIVISIFIRQENHNSRLELPKMRKKQFLK
jgi:hypothetical protein